MSTAEYLAVVFGTLAVVAFALVVLLLGTVDDYRDTVRAQKLREQALRAALLLDISEDEALRRIEKALND